MIVYFKMVLTGWLFVVVSSVSLAVRLTDEDILVIAIKLRIVMNESMAEKPYKLFSLLNVDIRDRQVDEITLVQKLIAFRGDNGDDSKEKCVTLIGEKNRDDLKSFIQEYKSIHAEGAYEKGEKLTKRCLDGIAPRLAANEGLFGSSIHLLLVMGATIDLVDQIGWQYKEPEKVKEHLNRWKDIRGDIATSCMLRAGLEKIEREDVVSVWRENYQQSKQVLQKR